MEISLYDITNNFKMIMEEETLNDTEKQKLQEELTLLLQQKSQNIIGYTKNIELTIEAMKNEEKRISVQRKALEKRLDDFKAYVKECMENNGFTKIETTLGTLGIRKNPISVEIIDETLIPEEYKEKVETIKVDKKKIADNFKATGELIDGVKINTDNTSLSIK